MRLLFVASVSLPARVTQTPLDLVRVPVIVLHCRPHIGSNRRSVRVMEKAARKTRIKRNMRNMRNIRTRGIFLK